ncbi:glycerol-3-phosphate 1-O-acyltransferase PlsY [Bhargavaea beijingensis]|uniref:Glycerol-3-phosphate acyltransferase n=1 Tax=Bhargavaea beijingensis TaxID=426756 RepID=A0A1G7DFH4_9BACL|nr:glycerol-3-phosphate 1-O-acyltransferase PlsY [Bhargavaea beijingensis]MCW1929186.1 glycerol-3-phosphate 1-O-acyltransferase PlsY [Bhargavaea beijingensis]RSK30921.1 glycerol-3-phosphate 1-O-acyltransferase PlsY [Bhargavaea beijingensis]SDE50358.1 glycerol-3-phosphate acyltransferase PlsY [Bhargavaea beijingensis]
MDTAVVLLIAYLLGSVPSGLWVGKLFYNKDIRESGSGNLGATNTFRVLGKKAGIAVTLMDILKGTAAVLLLEIPAFADSGVHPLTLGIAAVIGHMFPVFAKFRGGKAVATSGGVILGYSWPFFLVLIASFLVILKLTKIVSLTSMAMGVIALIYAIINYIRTGDLYLLIVVLVLSAFIFYRHRANIGRIKAGTEPKVKWL